jgi:hypothetical protein
VGDYDRHEDGCSGQEQGADRSATPDQAGGRQAHQREERGRAAGKRPAHPRTR